LSASSGKWFIVIGVALLAVLVAGASGATGSASEPVTQLYPASGNDWSTSGGDLASSRYSTLNQINTSNVSKLKVAWTANLNTPSMLGAQGVQGIEASPIESGGVLYVPTTTGLAALDAATGKAKWTYISTAPLNKACFGTFCLWTASQPSRDISMGDGMIFTGAQDGSIVALDQKTGRQVWQAQVASVGTTAASVKLANPWTVYANGLVLASINSGDSPIQGHIDAYNAKTGALVWRWFSTPDPTSLPFILTWTNPAEAATGGAAPWTRPAIDTKLNRVYFETGNAHANLSPGKNLWSASIVSLDLKTGKLMWYFQGIHHDQWDYDCATPPVLYNAIVAGKSIPGIAATCKSSYIFMLDRRNGRQIFPIKEVPVPNPGNQPLGVSWPTQPQTSGGSANAIVHCPTAAQVAAAASSPPPPGTTYVPTCPFAVPSPGSTHVWGGGTSGGADWMPMSFDPSTNDLIVCANGALNGLGGLFPTLGTGGYLTALNLGTNTVDWQDTFQASSQGVCYSGVLSTAGNVVFVSSTGQAPLVATASTVPKPFGGYFYAYDAKTGKQLFSYENVSTITAPAVTYMTGGKQYVAVYMTSQTDPNSFVGASALGDKLTIFTLP
jgi:glucose dehydrogenase